MKIIGDYLVLGMINCLGVVSLRNDSRKVVYSLKLNSAALARQNFAVTKIMQKGETLIVVGAS